VEREERKGRGGRVVEEGDREDVETTLFNDGF
jgi:hypothetical protein